MTNSSNPHNPHSAPPASAASQSSADLQMAAQAMRQMLELYHRSGLRWLVRDQDSPVDLKSQLHHLVQSHGPSSVAAAVVSTTTAASTSVSASASTSDPIVPKTAVTSASDTTTSQKENELARAKKVSAPDSATSPQPTTWQLPVLNLTEREKVFTDLKKKVAACKLCPELVAHRTQTVFGDGTLQPKVCFFGEAPGADEDKQGIPFVGRAGQLLDKIIESTTLKRPDDVYILNSLRCRPPGNRTPTPEEVECCRPFFEKQLEVLQPKYIVCLGAVAVRSILQNNLAIGALRGKFHQYRGAKVLVTYHPAYLLRNPDAKKLVWEDMQFLMADMGIKVPKGKQK